MATRVGVGIDQYVIANSKIELVTSGLIGCIGVSMTRADMAFLAHVSFADGDTNYDKQLRSAMDSFLWHCLDVIGAKAAPKHIKLVCSGSEGASHLKRLSWVSGCYIHDKESTCDVVHASGINMACEGDWFYEYMKPNTSENNYMFGKYARASSKPSGVIDYGKLSEKYGADASI